MYCVYLGITGVALTGVLGITYFRNVINYGFGSFLVIEINTRQVDNHGCLANSREPIYIETFSIYKMYDVQTYIKKYKLFKMFENGF